MVILVPWKIIFIESKLHRWLLVSDSHTHHVTTYHMSPSSQHKFPTNKVTIFLWVTLYYVTCHFLCIYITSHLPWVCSFSYFRVVTVVGHTVSLLNSDWQLHQLYHPFSLYRVFLGWVRPNRNPCYSNDVENYSKFKLFQFPFVISEYSCFKHLFLTSFSS